MENINSIRNEEDYKAALNRLEIIFDATSGEKGKEAKKLVDMICDYEDRHYPID